MKRRTVPHLVMMLVIGAGSLGAQDEVLTQFSTIDALLQGLYDGGMTVAQLQELGDFGLGTFEALDGEMVVIEGRFYRVAADGQVAEVAEGERTPFAAVTHFETDRTVPLVSGSNLDQVIAQVDSVIPSENLFYAIRLHGTFRSVKTRSIPRQQKPYRPLREVVSQQSELLHQEVSGTMVGFRCPPYVDGINVPGYHLHFLTDDRTAGGHVLEFVVEAAELALDETARFTLILPRDETFYGVDLSQDREQELAAVEDSRTAGSDR